MCGACHFGVATHEEVLFSPHRNLLLFQSNHMTKRILFLALTGMFLLSGLHTFSQSSTVALGDFVGRFNVITTAVPFLQISPDARSGGLADAGAAIDADANSLHWNTSKLAFSEKKGGVALSYAPWLRTLVPDVSLSYLSGYKKIDDRSAFGMSMRYFSLGSIQFTDAFGQPLGSFTPNEFAIDGGYSRKLSEDFSVGVNLRFIYSNLSGRVVLQGGQQTSAGIAGAGDISCYYKKDVKVQGKNLRVAFGGVISNIGNKITYTTSINRDFIPTNLRLGTYLRYQTDEFNSFGFIADVNKLLVPTPPIYETDSAGQPVLNPDGSRRVKSGMDPNVSVPQGMIQSFYDAPRGFKEELQEINYSLAGEYWYANQFAARAGFFHESPFKGNRRFLTFGFGVRYTKFQLDFAYLVPIQQRHPLANTLRFTLHINFGDSSPRKK